MASWIKGLDEIVIEKGLLMTKVNVGIAQIGELNRMLAEEQRRSGRLQEELDALKARTIAEAAQRAAEPGAAWQRAAELVKRLEDERDVRARLAEAMRLLQAVAKKIDFIDGDSPLANTKLVMLIDEIKAFVAGRY